MSQLPPGFVLDDPAPAPAKAGPIYGAPPKPEKPEQPKTTYRPMTADEVTARGLPPGSYQISSDGKIDTVAPTAKPNPGEGFEIGPDGVAKPIPGGKADTLANQRRGALAVLNAAGIDAATGYDPARQAAFWRSLAQTPMARLPATQQRAWKTLVGSRLLPARSPCSL